MIIKKYIAFLLTPKIITSQASSPYSINYDLLQQNGVTTLLFDFDDTLAEFNGPFSQKEHELLKKLIPNFKVAIISNCNASRKNKLIKEYNYVYIPPLSFKPFPEGYLEVLEQFNALPEQTAMIGDRPGTDLYGAYLAGIKERILVRPYSKVFGGKKPGFLYRWLRSFETIKCLIFNKKINIYDS